MKKQISLVTAASFLGIIVMLIPILAYTLFQGNNEVNTLGAESSEQRDSYELTSWKTLDEVAQILGKIDTGSTPFSVNLSQAILLVATSFIATLVTSLVIKRKIIFAV